VELVDLREVVLRVVVFEVVLEVVVLLVMATLVGTLGIAVPIMEPIYARSLLMTFAHTAATSGWEDLPQ
jgi:hypothetical protein